MLSDWWNGVELWVLGLAFPFQFALVIVVLAPLCLVVAWLIDRIVDHAAAWFGPSSTGEQPLDGAQPVDEGATIPEDAEIPDLTGKRVPVESGGR